MTLRKAIIISIAISVFTSLIVSISIHGLNKQAEAFCNENPQDQACIEWSAE